MGHKPWRTKLVPCVQEEVHRMDQRALSTQCIIIILAADLSFFLGISQHSLYSLTLNVKLLIMCSLWLPSRFFQMHFVISFTSSWEKDDLAITMKENRKGKNGEAEKEKAKKKKSKQASINEKVVWRNKNNRESKKPNAQRLDFSEGRFLHLSFWNDGHVVEARPLDQQ